MKSKVSRVDWRPLDAMTDEEINAAALADPDAQPMTEQQLRSMSRVPAARAIRRSLKISQQEFARRFQISIGTLRDWEQGRKVPEAAGRAYLKVISRIPSAEALSDTSVEGDPTPEVL